MSEYQCYELVALEQPLSAKQMAELRAISTRAEISPTRFWNEYHRGDLKADPVELIESYFDAHLYFTSWDEAVKLAIDRRDLAVRDKSSAAFAKRFDAMRKRRLRRRGFFDWKRTSESGSGAW